MTTIDEDLRRRELLGWVTEIFNDVEYLLHVLATQAAGEVKNDRLTRTVAQQLNAADSVALIRRLVALGAFQGHRDVIYELMRRASNLITDRNTYVHAVWTLENEGPAYYWTHQRLRDRFHSPARPPRRFDIEALEEFTMNLDGFCFAIADFWDLLRADAPTSEAP